MKPYEKGTHHLPFLLVPSAQDAAMLNVERMAELSAVEAIVLGVHQIFVKRNWYTEDFGSWSVRPVAPFGHIWEFEEASFWTWEECRSTKKNHLPTGVGKCPILGILEITL